jgi:hypothetical protein
MRHRTAEKNETYRGTSLSAAGARLRAEDTGDDAWVAVILRSVGVDLVAQIVGLIE